MLNTRGKEIFKVVLIKRVKKLGNF
jgi:hypothetical protein